MLGFVPATRFDETPDLEVRFPPLPRTLAEVSKMLSEMEDVPDIHRLVSIVDADPVVAGSVLRRINSAYYGLRRRISEIHKATYLLGFLEVCNLVLAEGMLKLSSIVRSEEQANIFKQIMELSIGTASFAQGLAIQFGLPAKGTVFTGGLLHCVGRLVLLYNKPNDYEALWWTNETGLGPSAESEQMIFGTDHMQLGALVAEHWHFPDEIVAAIRYYSDPNLNPVHESVPLTTLVSAGHAATEALLSFNGMPGGGTMPQSYRQLALLLQISPSEVSATIDVLRDSVRSFINEVVGG